MNEPAATRYVVLRQDTKQFWAIEGETDAKSAEGAIRKVAGEGATYVAVPARSWKPMRVEQVQTVQTVITAADEPDKPAGADPGPGTFEDPTS